MGIAFTCGVCDTRVTKSIQRKSYEEGVCLVQCPGCGTYHVIADNLGMYKGITEGKVNVEEMAMAKGESFTRVNSSVFDLEKLVAEPAGAAGKGEEGEGDVVDVEAAGDGTGDGGSEESKQ